jgi:hypothetical protein
MIEFPRTEVGGISLPRMIIGTNWFLGFSHQSRPKDNFIRSYQTSKNVADILCVFLEYGIDAVIGLPLPILNDGIKEAEQRTGKKMTRIMTPAFNIIPGGPENMDPERVLDDCRKKETTICMPHQMVTDALVDRMLRKIRDVDKYMKMIRDRGMIPALATHMPETIRYADDNGVDAETYIQMYNALGFLMQVEVDWVMRIISKAKKPVMAIKPLAAGKLTPTVGLAFVWNTIREHDMVCVGTTTPDEAKEVVEISLSYLDRRQPDHELQKTRSKSTLED